MTGLITDPQPQAWLETRWALIKKSALSTCPCSTREKDLEKFPKNINKFRDFLLLAKHKPSAEGRFSSFKYDFGEPKVRAGQEILLWE